MGGLTLEIRHVSDTDDELLAVGWEHGGRDLTSAPLSGLLGIQLVRNRRFVWLIPTIPTILVFGSNWWFCPALPR